MKLIFYSSHFQSATLSDNTHVMFEAMNVNIIAASCSALHNPRQPSSAGVKHRRNFLIPTDLAAPYHD
jgi:hypothetical protein